MLKYRLRLALVSIRVCSLSPAEFLQRPKSNTVEASEALSIPETDHGILLASRSSRQVASGHGGHFLVT